MATDPLQPILAWRWPLLRLALLLTLLFAGFWPTFSSMVQIWARSETFTHAFLILPITLYLIWLRRGELAALTPSASRWPWLLLLPTGLGWFLARLVDVAVVEQAAWVAMLPLAVWAVLGSEVAWRLLFPLGYLFFMVPFGEGFIPPLMQFTAFFTINAVKLTGIPIFAEGTFFTLPSGNWSVVEGCSGVRYLIASIALGALFSYLNFRSTGRRLLFMLLFIVVPIVANGLRAFMIVMIAHYSDMKLALGVDHYIYGWVFFGLVMFILFAIGMVWSEPPAHRAPTPGRSRSTVGATASAWSTLLVTALLIGGWPLLEQWSEQSTTVPTAAAPSLPERLGDWRRLDGTPPPDWKPHYQGMAQEQLGWYRQQGQWVGVYLAYYPLQRQDAELINSQNVLIPQKHPRWHQPVDRLIEAEALPGLTRLREGRLDGPQQLLVWSWNRIGPTQTTDPYWGKLLTAYNRLILGDTRAVGVVIFTPYSETDSVADRQRLQAVAQLLIETLNQQSQMEKPAR